MQAEPEEFNVILPMLGGAIVLLLLLLLLGLGFFLHWTGAVRVKRKGLLVQVLAAAAFSLVGVVLLLIAFSMTGLILDGIFK